MCDVALAAARVRDRLITAGVSYREVARRARMSNSTVREFAKTGSARIDTVARIEAILSDLPDSGVSGSAAKTDAQ